MFIFLTQSLIYMYMYYVPVFAISIGTSEAMKLLDFIASELDVDQRQLSDVR